MDLEKVVKIISASQWEWCVGETFRVKLALWSGIHIFAIRFIFRMLYTKRQNVIRERYV